MLEVDPWVLRMTLTLVVDQAKSIIGRITNRAMGVQLFMLNEAARLKIIGDTKNHYAYGQIDNTSQLPVTVILKGDI